MIEKTIYTEVLDRSFDCPYCGETYNQLIRDPKINDNAKRNIKEGKRTCPDCGKVFMLEIGNNKGIIGVKRIKVATTTEALERYFDCPDCKKTITSHIRCPKIDIEAKENIIEGEYICPNCNKLLMLENG